MKSDDDMIQYDIDVMDALKDFPTGDIDSVVYLRGRKVDDTKHIGIMYMHCGYDNLCQVVSASMDKSNNFKDACISSVFNYLLKDKNELSNFLENIKSYQK